MTRRELIGGAAAAAAGGVLAGKHVEAAPPQASGPREPNLTIREHLAREARAITHRAPADVATSRAFRETLPERRARFMEMLGLHGLPPVGERTPPSYKVTGVVDRGGYRIEKLHYESLPGLHVSANLYVPASLAHGSRAAAVLYVCGHAERQKVYYQAHPRRLAELGFVTLLAETVALGEAAGNHHGCYREGWFHWYSRGYTPAGIEAWNGMRGLDLLAARADVDAANMGVTGTSGGGATTWWVAAADERVRAAAPSCATAALASHVGDRVIDGHCDCMMWCNLYGWDLADVGALIAPRPLLIASMDRDGIFPIASVREVHQQLARLYRKLGASERLGLVTDRGPHSYSPKTRTAIFAMLVRELQGRDAEGHTVGDADTVPDRQESFDTLRVWAAAPAANRADTIHDDLLPPAQAPVIGSVDALRGERERVVAWLRERTFHAFPDSPPPLDIELVYEHLEGAGGARFAFTSERGWRLAGDLRRVSGEARAPVLVSLRSPGEARRETEDAAARIPFAGARAVVEPRGTGETAWGAELGWHVRRAAAWTGRTVASMRVWDTLRALAAVRSLPGVDPARVSLHARGELCAVALYAALLDGGVGDLWLQSPPPTQNEASRRDGRGPAIEMLGCLRVTDVWQVAGLLYPAHLHFIGEAPATYRWATDLHAALRAGGGTKVQD